MGVWHCFVKLFYFGVKEIIFPKNTYKTERTIKKHNKISEISRNLQWIKALNYDEFRTFQYSWLCSICKVLIDLLDENYSFGAVRMANINAGGIV